MRAAAHCGAKDLLPRDVQEAFQTGEVLELEFKLIHGSTAWNPQGLSPDQARRKLRGEDSTEQVEANSLDEENKPDWLTLVEEASADQAAAETTLVDERNEADRLALHAWSVQNLGNGAGQAALCLSGGGIRSAAFGLGILQGLARRGLLSQFHYLSTVSGGGYIASWLTAWRHRAKRDEDVLEHLKGRKFGEFDEPEPLGRLRFNQNFLTPRVGLASAEPGLHWERCFGTCCSIG